MILEDFFECLRSQYHKQLPFVAYQCPNENSLKGFLQNTDELYYTSDFNEKGFVFAPFKDIQKTILFPLEQSNRITTQGYLVGRHIANNKIDAREGGKALHMRLVDKALEAIDKGILKKVVVSRREELELYGQHPLEVFKNLLNVYNTAFVYCWYHPKIGLWLGATPETLIQIEEKRLSIMALAATQLFNGSINVDWNDKEMEEQQVVTDFIIERLKPFVENIQVSNPQTVKAGHLLHLKTMVTANLKYKTPKHDLINALHPTPAVCGLPQDKAKEFILNNEQYDREYYTGFLGELNLEKDFTRSAKRNIENRAFRKSKSITQLYVNLRCAQIYKNTIIIYVGGGITKQSKPEQEWIETVNKSDVMKSSL